MNLLFATSIVPDGGLGSGYEIANAVIVDALRRAGASVTVLGFTWPGRTPSDPENTVVLGEVDVRTDGASIPQKLAWLAASIQSGVTFSSVKLRVVGEDAVREAVRRAGPFDGVVLNSVQFAGAFERVFAGLPSIFVAHNVEHRSAQENAAATGGLERWLYRREAVLLKALESRLCRRADFVFTLAEEDRAALGVDDPARSAALPLVTRTVEPPAAPGRRDIGCEAALVGTWTWQPNRIGLDWFLSQVVPRLRPGFRIRIAGQMPAGMAATHPGVEFVGRVPDAQAFVASGAVVPLISRAGTGVQLKTIETFELGLPSVATLSSLRGIAHVPDNCVVTDDPAAFAAALERTARQPGPAADGSLFFHRQRRELDARIRLGLAKLDQLRRRGAAA